jgi:hypothetical protein
MMWIPFWAAGVVNGLGHAMGYRNFECRDAATNLVPWGIVIGGEELHNNHHTYPNSAKLSVKRWEFDMGWAWITCSACCAWPRCSGWRHRPPGGRQGQPGHGHRHGDPQQPLPDHGPVPQAGDRPAGQAGAGKGRHSVRHQFRRAKRLLSRETSLLEDRHHVRIQNMLEHSQALKTIYERLALQQIWASTSANGHDMLAAIKDWVHEAEASGIHALRDFAAQLKTYSCARPAPDRR